MTELRECSRCGENRPSDEFYWNESKGRFNSWCKPCYRDWYAGRGGYTTMRQLMCQWCDQSFESPYARSKFCSYKCKRASLMSRRRGGPSRKADRLCRWCGSQMERKMRSDAAYCSADCNKAAHNVTQRMGRRAGAPLVSRADIAVRDNYRCGICGGKVNMALRHPEPLCASLDHILPLALGGGDEPANLQLAHLRCNAAKQHRGLPTQLRLIG